MNEHFRQIKKIRTAFVEAAAPELRAEMTGGKADEERFKEELLFQLEARGVTKDDD